MRRLMGIWAATCVLAGLCVVASLAQDSARTSVPRLIRFSGVVRQVGEKPARGVVELSFSLFKEEAGGEPLWFESQTVEVDAQGRYNVLLGAMHPDGLPMDLFTSGEARWLSIMVGKIEQPRVLLVSVPYALKAGDAESLGGKPATAYVATDQLKEQVATAISDPKIGLRTLNTMVMASSGGSDTPPALVNETVPATFTCTTAGNCVTVTQNGAGNTLFATQTAVSGVVSAVRGETTSPQGRPIFGWAKSTTGLTFGVWGQTASVDGAGLFGSATSTTGQSYGLWGQAASTVGAGIYGSATATTGINYGIFGSSSSTSGVAIRAQALAASGTTMGLRAIVNSATGTAGVFDNLAGGKLISARITGLVEKFSVSGTGDLVTAGSVTGASASFAGAVSGGAFTGTSFSGGGSGLTGVNATTLDGIDSTAFAPSVGSAAYVSRLGDIMAGQLVLPANGLAAGGSQLVLSSGRVGVGVLSPLAQLHVDGTDATDGAGASAVDALLVAGGDGGDQGTDLGTAGNGGSITLIGGNGGVGLPVDASGGNGGSISLQPGAGGSGDLNPGSAGNVLLAPNGTGSVGIGTSTPGQKLEVNGGVRLNTATARPACSVITRGTFWVTFGGAGVEDLVEVCTKDAADAYAWRNVI